MTKEVFFISPIGDEGTETRKRSDSVLKHIIKKSLDEDTYDVIRADEDGNPDSITPRMIKRIQDAFMVFADISGGNPNVFYEIALAHGYRKPIIYLSEGGALPPFDIKDARIISYNLSDPDNLDEARDRVVQFMAHIEKHPDDQHNPVADADAFFALRESNGAGTDQSAALADALEILSSDMKSIRNEIARLRDGSSVSRREESSNLRSMPISLLAKRLFSRLPTSMADSLSPLWTRYATATGEEKIQAGRRFTLELEDAGQGAPPDLAPYFQVLQERMELRLHRLRREIKARPADGE